MQSLMASGDHALFNEIEDGVGDDVRVNAEVSAVMQVLQSSHWEYARDQRVASHHPQ